MQSNESAEVMERKWVKPSQISKHLTCSICEEVFTNPRRLNCSHTFCEHCIKKWFSTQKTCPQCRKSFKLKDLGKDLIAEKIINDLEVFCVNDKYCKWKDKLELLPRHVEACEFQDKNLTDWLQGFDRFTDKPKATDPLFLMESEHLQERINNEMPKAPLLARLYTKDSSSKALFKETFVPQNVENNNIFTSKQKEFEILEGILNDNDEESEIQKTIDLNKTKDLVLPHELEAKIIIGDDLIEKQGEDTILDDSEEKAEEEKKNQNDENVNPEKKTNNEEKEVLEIPRNELEMAKKRKFKEPALCLKLKQMKT